MILLSATQESFKNYAPFTKCITKIEATTIEDAKDLNLVQIILKQQEVDGFIQKKKQLILIIILKTLIILNLSSIRLNY